MLARPGGGNIHFRHYFHPAGHGTFFTGHIRRDGADADDVVWVYDCGSKRWTHLDRLVDQVVARLAPRNFIDMVCLSHFDSDHVNGIEALLSKARVGALVLPYLSAETRLRLASNLMGSEPSAHRLAAMILDPSRYLAERGQRERVERLILIRGGSSDAAEPAHPHEHLEPGDALGEGMLGKTSIDTHPLEQDEVGHQDRGWVEVAEHGQPCVLGGVYELTFYNTALPHGQTPRSGAGLSVIADDVAGIVTAYNLCASAAPTTGWVQALKQLYRHHFGGSSRQKNDISLCVLGRPLVTQKALPCRKFGRLFSHKALEIPLVSERKQAVMMTGDITLDAVELDCLKRHVGPARWNSVGVMQVPHHGSQHSWESGLSVQCVHHHSVICAGPSTHHPHTDVECDLAGRTPICATYTEAVTFDYHIA